MKEVRYNDKLWFGKHKGVRVCDVIKADPNHIQKLIKEQVIKLDDKSKVYFEERYGPLYKKSQPGLDYPPPGGRNIVPPDFEHVNPPPLGRPQAMNVSTTGRFYDEEFLKPAIEGLMRELFRNTPRNIIGPETLTMITNHFIKKIKDLELPPFDITIRLTRNPNMGRNIERYDVIAQILSTDRREIALFDLG